MQKSDQINELAAALAKAQGEFLPVPKDAQNPFLKNNYATLDAVINANRGVLSKHGLAIMQLLGGDITGSTVETVLMHSSGQWISETAQVPNLEVKRGLNEAQTWGVAISYTKRYAECAALNVSTGEDTDGFTGAPKEEPPTESAPQSDQQFVAKYVRSIKSAQGKPYIVFGNDTTRASWFKGRGNLLAVAPWLAEQGITKDKLGILDTDHAIKARVYYALSTKTDQDGNPYKNVVTLEKVE